MPMTAQAPQRSVWRFFPHAMIGALGLVMAVNGGMIWAAFHTFPGVAATDVFDHSNQYDAVLKEAGREAAMGWTVQMDADSPSLVLTGPDGKALQGAAVVASARRPVGPDQTTTLTFVEAAPGHYAATMTLPARGQWELRLTVTNGGQALHATRRVLIK